MKIYSNVNRDADVLDFCKDVARKRQEDVKAFDNLKEVFVRGRKTDKVPTSSSDTTGDRVGDVNYTATYLYICVDNAGTAAWRRVAIGSF